MNLRREYVHSPDDEHVIGTPHRLFHAHQSPAAVAFCIVEARYIPGPVADHGKGFLGKGRQNQFAHAAWRQGASRFRVDDLRYESIFAQMHTVLAQTLTRNTRANNLRQAVVIGCVET